VIKTTSNKLQIKTKVIIAFVLLFIDFCAIAQSFEIHNGDTINRIDENKKKQGYWYLYKETDKGEKYLAEEGKYSDGKKNGTWIEYFGNGNKKNKINFVDGRPNGLTSMYSSNGILMEKGTWKNNRWVGEYSLYNECNGNLKQQFQFNDKGQRDGLQKFFYANGKIMIEGHFKNGKEDGIFNHYDGTGNIIGTVYYIEGVETNQSMLANKDFIKRIEKITDSIEKINCNIWTSSNKDLKTLDGYNTTYNSNKQITKEGVFSKNRLMEGKAYIYDNNGVLEKIAIYKNGGFVEYEFDSKISKEEKEQKELVNQLKSINEQLNSIKGLYEEKQKEVEQKNNQLLEQTLENQVLAKDKKIKELLIAQQNNTLKEKESEALKKEYFIATLNKDKKIKEIELANQKSENSRKKQELAIIQKQRKFQETEIKQQKFIQKLMIAGSGLLVVFLIFVFFSLNKSRKANKLIAAQKAEVEKQKEISDSQKHLIEEKQTEIIESITYAKRLQEAILPPQAFINSFIPTNFVLYKPKDIVAGDFYWAENIGDLFFIAAADSTGHGVPGAMVSVVCSNALNRSVKEFNLTETGKILDKTKELVVETFEKSTSEVKDGMDISLLCIDTKNKKVFWSGANNPLWYASSLPSRETGASASQFSKKIIGKEEMLAEALEASMFEIKADKQPIGKTDKVNPFTTHEIEYKENTTFYLFTDGFADQFGGPNGKKFKYKPFAEILVQNVNKSPSDQSAILAEKFEAWKGELEQVDDVCVIGIRI